jgi:hypothetical protein
MIFRNNYDARVVSVRDFDTVLTVSSVYHPLCKVAARRRLIRSYPQYAQALKQAFDNKGFKSSWGIVIQDAGQPVIVLQNLACDVKNSSFRRMLRINVDDTYPPRATVLTDTYPLVQNTLTP